VPPWPPVLCDPGQPAPAGAAYAAWLALVAAQLASPLLVGYYEGLYPWERAYRRGIAPDAAVREMWAVLGEGYAREDE
jgi:hypothetical protein